MLKAELTSYKINRLDMVNCIGADGTVAISEKSCFAVDFEDGMAVATLMECLEMDGSHDKFHMELEMEGRFSIGEITTNKARKEALVKFYDSLFPYAEQFIRMLGMNTGMPGMAVKKKFMDPQDVNIGGNPKAVEGKKVIEFHPDK